MYYKLHIVSPPIELNEEETYKGGVIVILATDDIDGILRDVVVTRHEGEEK